VPTVDQSRLNVLDVRVARIEDKLDDALGLLRSISAHNTALKGDIDRIDVSIGRLHDRLDRIERRLELAD